MEAESTSETSVNIYLTAQHIIPEDILMRRKTFGSKEDEVTQRTGGNYTMRTFICALYEYR
jgi:hypothetical protein